MRNGEAPEFRFSPNAYEEGRSIERSDASCEVCFRPCGWRYTGSIYTASPPGTLCVRCIADGSLGRFIGGGGYTLHDVEMDGADPALEREVMERTPGIACFNPYTWPVLDGMPLAFIGYGEDAAVTAMPEARAAIAAAFVKLGWDAEESSPYALVFREIDGPRWQAVIDLD